MAGMNIMVSDTMKRKTRLMAVGLIALLFVSLGAATHTPLGDSNPAHNAQDEEIVANQEAIEDLESEVDDLDTDLTDLRDRVARDEQVGMQKYHELRNGVDSLQDRVSDLEGSSATHAEVQAVQNDLDDLRDTFQAERDRVVAELKEYSDTNDRRVLDAANSYTDQELRQLAEHGKLYVDQQDDAVLDDAQDYTDAQLRQFAQQGKLYVDAQDEQVLEAAQQYADENDENTHSTYRFGEFVNDLREFWENPQNFIKKWVRDNFVSQNDYDEDMKELRDELRETQAHLEYTEGKIDKVYHDSGVPEPKRSEAAINFLRENNDTDSLTWTDEDGNEWFCEQDSQDVIYCGYS